ncbi:MAG: hypothetical protein KC431_09965, partial [Myxococcales bacterium]|nr:hypothetical protein [Myxococcales bacterium]
YEKACRGPLPALADEYAWGTTSLAVTSVLLGADEHREVASGNAQIDNSYRPLAGAVQGRGPVDDDSFVAAGQPFAHQPYPPAQQAFHADGRRIPDDHREQQGASYYCLTGLSGNLWEPCVSAGHPIGRAFIGSHGDGKLDEYGLPDFAALGWPGLDADGVALRGGSWYTGTGQRRVADRSQGGQRRGYCVRSFDLGFRAARTAPTEPTEE